MKQDDELPELVIPLEARDNLRGSPSARYTLVEYGDYTSVHCRHLVGAIDELVRELGDDLCVAFRNSPTPRKGSLARTAAEFAEAAGLQGKFWLMHDRIFANQDELTEPAMRKLARELPVEMSDFERDLASGEAARRVDADLESAEESGVGDVPTLFLNGRLHVGEYEFLPLLKALQSSPTS